MSDEDKKGRYNKQLSPRDIQGARQQQAPQQGPTQNSAGTQQNEPGQSLGPEAIGPSRQSRGKRKRQHCPIHTQYEILFHCHACDLDICKLCWKIGHTGNKRKHHDVVYIEFMKQKEFAEKLDKFNFEDKFAEIDFQSKLCGKSVSHLKSLIEKLHQEKDTLRGEVEVCDQLIKDFGRLQAMTRAKDFDHTNEAVLHFMALTDSPYDTRDPILTENDKFALEELINEVQNLVYNKSPESSAVLSVPENSDDEPNE